MSPVLRWVVAAVIGSFSIICLGCALFSGALAPWLIGETIAQVERLEPTSFPAFEDGEPGREVLIEGVVSERNPVENGFVAYERYVAQRDPDGDLSWRKVDEVRPPLRIDLRGGSVRVVGNYRLESPGDEDETEGERFVGLRVGTPVIAVGRLTQGQEEIELDAEFIGVGTRDEFLQDQRELITFFRILSALFAPCGIALLIAAVALAAIGIRRRA